jgi:hypothetical protein
VTYPASGLFTRATRHLSVWGIPVCRSGYALAAREPQTGCVDVDLVPERLARARLHGAETPDAVIDSTRIGHQRLVIFRGGMTSFSRFHNGVMEAYTY